MAIAKYRLDIFTGTLTISKAFEKNASTIGSAEQKLADVEYIVVAKEGNFFFFVGFFILDRHPLPENNHGGFFAFANSSARRLYLLEGSVFSGAVQQHLVEQAVWLAGGVTDATA